MQVQVVPSLCEIWGPGRLSQGRSERAGTCFCVLFWNFCEFVLGSKLPRLAVRGYYGVVQSTERQSLLQFSPLPPVRHSSFLFPVLTRRRLPRRREGVRACLSVCTGVCGSWRAPPALQRLTPSRSSELFPFSASLAYLVIWLFGFLGRPKSQKPGQTGGCGPH